MSNPPEIATLGDESRCFTDLPNDEIKISTGPSGDVIGSVVTINGRQLHNITGFSVEGKVGPGEKWNITIKSFSSIEVD